MRAGPRKAKATAWIADVASNIQYSTKSKATPKPIQAELVAIAS